MKTFWQRYDEKWAHAKRREFEAKTGVAWDFYGARGGTQFGPVLSMKDDTATTDLALAERARKHVPWTGIGFVKLAELSGLSLPQVLIAARTLLLASASYSPDTGRHGKIVGLHRRLP